MRRPTIQSAPACKQSLLFPTLSSFVFHDRAPDNRIHEQGQLRVKSEDFVNRSLDEAERNPGFNGTTPPYSATLHMGYELKTFGTAYFLCATGIEEMKLRAFHAFVVKNKTKMKLT
ncbi:MAG: hypothetical protein ACXWGW_07840 [Methylobacter sp.]